MATKLKQKSRAQLREQIASKQGLDEIKSICEEEGIALSDAYNYMSPKETNTSEANEKTDTIDQMLALDGLRVFSEEDRPANPLSDFKKTYQKDCFWEKCADVYNRNFTKGNLMRTQQRSYAGLHEPGSPGNPYSTVQVAEAPLMPEVPIAGLTSKVDYVSTSNVEIPTITNVENSAAANMISNPPGTDTRHVTIQVGDMKVKLQRVGVGLLWEPGFEDSELSGPAIARFANQTAVNDLNVLGRAGIKLLVEAAGATSDITVAGSWDYEEARNVETVYKNGYLMDAAIGRRTPIIQLDAARAIAYGGNLRPEQDAALSNVTGSIQTLNFTTDESTGGVAPKRIYLYNRGRTLGIAFRGREIVITRDYELPQKDMMVRYFRRYGAMYLQHNAPTGLVTVP